MLTSAGKDFTPHQTPTLTYPHRYKFVGIVYVYVMAVPTIDLYLQIYKKDEGGEEEAGR